MAFLKWAGGKRSLLDKILPLIPRGISAYYEPFLGGGSVAFEIAKRINKPRLFLSDINSDLIVTYVAVRDHLEDLIEELRLMKSQHSSEFYYRIRASEPETLVSRAARMIYLNKTCFNGLYRVNLSGKFNVPIGSYSNPNICDVVTLRNAHYLLLGTVLRCGDFAEETGIPQNSFVYMDPPYYNTFTSYSRGGFNDHERLKTYFDALTDAGIRAAVSNSLCDYIVDLYSDYMMIEVTAKRSINSDGNGRGSVGEVIITNENMIG